MVPTNFLIYLYLFCCNSTSTTDCHTVWNLLCPTGLVQDWYSGCVWLASLGRPRGAHSGEPLTRAKNDVKAIRTYQVDPGKLNERTQGWVGGLFLWIYWCRWERNHHIVHFLLNIEGDIQNVGKDAETMEAGNRPTDTFSRGGFKRGRYPNNFIHSSPLEKESPRAESSATSALLQKWYEVSKSSFSCQCYLWPRWYQENMFLPDFKDTFWLVEFVTSWWRVSFLSVPFIESSIVSIVSIGRYKIEVLGQPCDL